MWRKSRKLKQELGYLEMAGLQRKAREDALDELELCKNWTIAIHTLGNNTMDRIGYNDEEIVVDVRLNSKVDCIIVLTVPADAVSITDRIRERGYSLKNVCCWEENGAYIKPLNFSYNQ